MNSVPFLARVEDYLGAWSYEPTRFLIQLECLRGLDLVAHMRAAKAVPAQPTQRVGGSGKPQVAVVPVVGTLMKGQSSLGGSSTVALRQEIRALAADPAVSAIVLAIDSPGGTVAGTAALAADIKAARRAKPVVAQIEDLGASAAYWLASQATAVFANEKTALVGSIGTLQTVTDSSAAAERDGVKVYRFATGPLKGAGTAGTAVTEEMQRYFQGMVEAAQVSFDAAVASGRSLSESRLAKVKTGGVFLATEAQALGLIDGIQSLDRTVAELSRR
ncbi:MAG TPA: S49 family peptidase [Urbifossiella sp.]|nr:S49 family peptidase [Urbifossiella sp.]